MDQKSKDSGKSRTSREKKEVRTWCDILFWRDVVFYFVAFAYFGRFIEMGWTWLGHLVLGRDLAYRIIANPIEPYMIYGTGALLCILLVVPLVRRWKTVWKSWVSAFLAGTLVTSVLEYLSSVVMVRMWGYNPYWWYIDRPFNLGGHIWLGNALLFGLLAMVFVKGIYPLTERFLRWKQWVVNILLVLLVALFCLYYVGKFAGWWY